MKYVKKLLKNNKKNNQITTIKLASTEITIEPTDKTKIYKKQIIIFNETENEPDCIINLEHIIYIK